MSDIEYQKASLRRRLAYAHERRQQLEEMHIRSAAPVASVLGNFSIYDVPNMRDRAEKLDSEIASLEMKLYEMELSTVSNSPSLPKSPPRMAATPSINMPINNPLPKDNTMWKKNFHEPPSSVFEPEYVNESHVALLILADTSLSMQGTPIAQLNKALNDFKAKAYEHDQVSRCVEVAIVEFNSDHKTVQSFRPVNKMNTINLYATGSTNMAPAIEDAIEMVRERTTLYAKRGAEPHKPWIVLISDGAPDGGISSVTGVAKKIQTRLCLKM